MSAYAGDQKTLAYQLGEKLSEMTDHFLLMTATPHKGDPENSACSCRCSTRTSTADIKSLQEAMRRNEAPFYLRRTKEALVTFPDPDTGEVHKLFTKRDVRTAEFDLDGDELDFYDDLTRYVEDQSMKAASRGQCPGPGRRLHDGHAPAPDGLVHLRRQAQPGADARQASRRSSTTPKPTGSSRSRGRVPDDFDELPEDEQQEIIAQLEDVVASVDPAVLKAEIAQPEQAHRPGPRPGEAGNRDEAHQAQERPQGPGLLRRPDEEAPRLHRAQGHARLPRRATARTAGPMGKLREWGLTVTQIHGGMKIGDRDTPGSRIYAEREFRESAQVLVATEAAGEGINLQFCWQMINYDIPWNPVRLEQRVGRIHRYGQEHDCLIFNFVAQNTREGRVLQKLLERLREIRNELGTDQVFDVVGEIFPANLLEKLFRDMYARRTNEHAITDRIVREIDPTDSGRSPSPPWKGLRRRN